MISGKTNSRIINGFQKKERHKKACEICWELEIQTLEMRERERERERNAQRVRGSAHCITLEASESEEEELLMDSVFGEGSLGGIWSG